MTKLLDNLAVPVLKHFEVKTLEIKSTALKNNPLKDPTVRYNPVLVPKTKFSTNLPVVYILSGFTGNGPKSFGLKSFEDNYPQVIDRLYGSKQAPKALYVFVDAFSFWGGSQFINSPAVGNYETYFVKELHPAVIKSFRINSSAKKTALVGGSSGGYGALHLSSKYPDKFSVVASLAPDSDFSSSLIGDLYVASPYLKSKKSFRALRDAHFQGEILKLRSGHSILNSIGMSACYSPKNSRGEFDFPIDMITGEKRPQIWKKWLAKDPIVFLEKRKQKLKQLHRVFLEVGDRDQFHLYFGARKIHQILKKNRVNTVYNEFSGTHWDLATRRPQVLSFLKRAFNS